MLWWVREKSSVIGKLLPLTPIQFHKSLELIHQNDLDIVREFRPGIDDLLEVVIGAPMPGLTDFLADD